MSYLTLELCDGPADFSCPSNCNLSKEDRPPKRIIDFAMKPPRKDPPLGLVVIITLIVLAACARSAFGLGIELPDHDAFATARGNAFVATADDPAAIYYNPAGISQLDGINVSVGAYGLTYQDQYKSPAGSTMNSRREWTALPDIFATFALPRYHVTLGLGFYSPYGLVQEWSSTAPFAYVGRRGEVDYFTLNPVIAYQPFSTLSFSAGPTLNYSEADLRQDFPGSALFPGSPAFGTHFAGRAEALGFNAGILWHPWEQHSFGVTYRNSTDMNYKGHADLPPPPFGPGAGTGSSADFKFPRSVDFGYSYRPTSHWNLEADAEWIDWATLNNLVLVGSSIPGKPILETIPFNWNSSWIFKVGGTYYFSHGWRASAGYMYVQNSVPEQNFNPLIPDSDRHVFSVGIGQHFHKLSWDAAYQFAWGPSRSVTSDTAGGVPSPADGSYEFLSHAITINVGYHF
jgi:long-chain fatty acid transport protein